MRKTFAVTVIADKLTTEIHVSGCVRIGSTYVDVEGLPEVNLVLPADTPSHELLKDALVHVIEHL